MKKVDQEDLEKKVEIYFQKIDLYDRIERLVNSIISIPIRLQHRSFSRKEHKKYRDYIKSISKHLYEPEIRNNKNFYTIFNLSLYLMLLIEDFLYLHDGQVISNGKRDKQFFAKLIAVQLYESSDDLKILLGKPLRDSLFSLYIPNEIIKQLEEVKSKLNLFSKRNEKYLMKIRNLIGAHRDHNTILYLETYDSINSTELTKITTEYIGYLNSLFEIITKIVQFITQQIILYREIMERGKN